MIGWLMLAFMGEAFTVAFSQSLLPQAFMGSSANLRILYFLLFISRLFLGIFFCFPLALIVLPTYRWRNISRWTLLLGHGRRKTYRINATSSNICDVKSNTILHNNAPLDCDIHFTCSWESGHLSNFTSWFHVLCFFFLGPSLAWGSYGVLKRYDPLRRKDFLAAPS